ncbi:MAG TPA: methionine synthase [Actinobacteria bacterium]|nr:methionine synthase [Actinomycetota bacterium]
MSFPWEPAAATGIGSLPGEDSREAARILVGELPDFLHVPELPNRGPGGDCIGRTGALLHAVGSDFGLETTADGWRITDGKSRLMRRAISWIGEDLDALEEFGQDYSGPLKTQIAGPWTLAASIELAGGERLLKDAGACRDLAGALAEAVRTHVAELKSRFPMATILLQVDEPGLNAVLDGTIGSVSGLSRFDPVDPPVAQDALREVLTAVPEVVSGVHCCAARPPIRVITNANAGFVSFDLTLAGIDEDAIGEAWESGVGIWAGSVNPLAHIDARKSDAMVSAPMRTLAHHLGMEDAEHMASVVITPSCGCAGARWSQVRSAYSACVRAGRVLRQEEPSG